jgi:hypothetical protein
LRPLLLAVAELAAVVAVVVLAGAAVGVAAGAVDVGDAAAAARAGDGAAGAKIITGHASGHMHELEAPAGPTYASCAKEDRPPSSMAHRKALPCAMRPC